MIGKASACTIAHIRRPVAVGVSAASAGALLLSACASFAGPESHSRHGGAGPSTHAVSASPAQYRVTNLNAYEKGVINPLAMNDRGDVAGKLWMGKTRGFLYSSGHLTSLGTPTGFARSIAWSVNDKRAILAGAWNGHEAWQWAGSARAWFVVREARRRFAWTRLRAPRGYSVTSGYLGQIASNGDVAGTIRHGSGPGATLRAAIWSSSKSGGRYSYAQVLPLSSGYSTSQAALIFTDRRRLVVAGDQGNSTTSGLVLWSRPRRTTASTAIPGILELRGGWAISSGYVGDDIAAIGGWGDHIYGAGGQYIPGANYGIGETDPRAGPIQFSRSGVASITYFPSLSAPGSGPYAPLGVSAGRNGEMLAVGSSGEAPKETAIIWRGDCAGRRIRRLLGSGSLWRPRYAVAVNTRGQVTGTATVRGRWKAYLLTPKTAQRRAPGYG